MVTSNHIIHREIYIFFFVCLFFFLEASKCVLILYIKWLFLFFLVSQSGQQRPGDKKNKVSSTRQTVIENGDLDHHDNDDTETLIGSQFGKSRSHDKDNINLNNGLPSLQSIGEPAMKLSGMKHFGLHQGH